MFLIYFEDIYKWNEILTFHIFNWVLILTEFGKLGKIARSAWLKKRY